MLKYIFVRSGFWDIFAYFYVENRKKSRKNLRMSEKSSNFARFLSSVPRTREKRHLVGFCGLGLVSVHRSV
jgi:hypothetical protein